MSVFISWSGADRDVKNVIAARLQEEKIEYFDSDEHCASDFSKECIENIRRSTVFLVIISEHSMNSSSYVINEVIEARQRENAGALNILVYKITDAPYTERFAFNLNHISDANHISRSEKLGATGAIDTLIKRIRHLEKLRAEGRPEKPYDVLVPSLLGTPIATRSYLGYFVEGSRADKLYEIDSAFERSGTVIISEFFGYGKKSIIKRHAANSDYTAAIELDAMGASIRDFFVSGLSFTNVNPAAFEGKDEKTVIKKKLEMLSRLDKKTLIVIINAELEGEPDELIITLLGTLRCRVAIVTQSEAEEYRDYFPVLTVGRMTDEQLTEMFYHYYDRGGFADRDELTPLLHSFFEEISGHTKTVELAATVLAKEIHADTSAAKNYLTARGSDNASLTEKITSRISDIIELESFTEAEKNVLLIIALSANPTLQIEELKLILAEAGLEQSDANAVLRLKDNRWISYNHVCRTVSIEPLIARLCVAKLMKDYKIAEACLKRLSTVYQTSHAHTFSAVFTTLDKMERMLELLSLGEAANALHAFSVKKKSAKADGVANERFLNFFESFLENYDAQNDRDAFVIKAAAWVLFIIIPASEIFSNIPTLKNDADLDDAISNLGDEYLSLAGNQDVIDAFAFFEMQNDDRRIYEIFNSFSHLVLSADFEQMETLLDEIIDMLDTSDILSDAESCDMITGIVKLFCVAADAVGAYRAALSVLERLIAYDLPPYNAYQLLVAYSGLLIECDDPPQSPSEIMAMAEDMLAQAARGGAADAKNIALSRGDLLVAYATALASEGDFDGALEKIDELDEIGRLDASPNVISLLSEIAEAFTLRGNKAQAVAVAERYEEFLREVDSDYELHESYRECARSVLAFLIPDDDIFSSDFGRGGIVENPGYYQKYSHDKKNNLFKMMKYRRVADAVKRYDFTNFTSEDILAHSVKLRARARGGEQKMNLAPEAFALVSEVGARTLGYRHHYVQYVGAAAMLDGNIAEILNGEGKTYTITLVAFVNSLYSERVFVTDNSQYLTERNYKWMRGLYSALGVCTRLILPKDKFSHFIDSAGEDICYVSAQILATAMMYRDNLTPSQKRDLKRFSIIADEADTVLVEEAKSPARLVENSRETFYDKVNDCKIAWDVVSSVLGNDLYYTRKKGRITLSAELHSVIEQSFGLSYSDVSDSIILSDKEKLVKRALYYAELKNGADYVIKNGVVLFENESNGTLYKCAPENAYFILKKEGADTAACENEILKEVKTVNLIYVFATISAFGAFAGTSATAASFRKEFKDLYDLEVVAIPTALPIQRKDRTVTLYTSRDFKDEAIIGMIREKHEKKQPVLLIVRNIVESIRYSRMLSDAGIKHSVLNAANSESSPEMLAGAGRSGSVLVATQLANRGVDIKLGGDAERMTLYELIRSGVDVTGLEDMLYTIPTEQTLQSEIYRKYTALLEVNKLRVAADKELALAAGGLAVISADPYDNMRVEQQIRGRAGRQGAVGESYIFESLDDEVLGSLVNPGIISRIKNMVGENELISASFLTRSIEKAKERLHHITFADMKSGKNTSERIERSKARVRSYVADGFDAQASSELIELWANDERIVTELEMILEGYAPRGNSALARAAVSYPELFENGNDADEGELLLATARTLIERMPFTDDEKEKLLRLLLREALTNHLTDIQKNNNDDSWNGVKHSEKFYSKKYDENLNHSLVAAVDKWLCCAFAIPKRKRPTVTRTLMRNDPCPCGSGRKYKFCCGAGKSGTDSSGI